MVEVESDIVAAGAEIIWVLEKDHTQTPGTADLCMSVMDELDATDRGWCVGDAQTEPTPGTFDAAPFAVGRGFDMLVDRGTMEVLWTSSHGTPGGNENIDGAEVLRAVQDAVAGR